jgi:hypothetical protein
MVQMSIGRNVENESLRKGKSSTPSLVCPTPHPHFMLSTKLGLTTEISPMAKVLFDKIPEPYVLTGVSVVHFYMNYDPTD